LELDEGTWALEEILRNPACEAATALMIYWRAQPEYFLQFADRGAWRRTRFTRSTLRVFDFLAKLEPRYLAGAFPIGSIAFDPSDPEHGVVGFYDDLRERFVRALPGAMYTPVRPGA
jgi:hypothetical protein